MQKVIRWLTLTRLIPIVTLICVFLIATRTPVDTDMFWHLRAGEWQAMEGRLLHVDVFSHTRYGQPWLNLYWLAQLTLYGMYAVLHETGLALFVALLAVGGMFFVYRQCEGEPIVAAFAVVLGAMTAAIFWSPRPQMVSFLLSTVVLYLLWLYRKKGVDRLWLIPLLMIPWANMHGGFAIGFILLVLATAGEGLRWLFEGALGGMEGEERPTLRPVIRLMVIGLISAAAIRVNPYGPALLLHPFRTVGIDLLRQFIQEWSSPDFHSIQTWPFIWLLLGTLAAVGLSPKPLDWRDAVMVTGTAYSALLAARNVAVFAVVCTPVLAYHVNAWLEGRDWRLNWRRIPAGGAYGAINWLLAILLGAGAIGRLLVVTSPEVVKQESAASLPVGAVAFLEENRPPGPLFNDYNWGGYLMWAARDYPVYIDGRTDLYGDELLAIYRDVIFTRSGWQDTLDEAGINVVLIQANSLLADRLAEEPGWVELYRDEVAAIFAREQKEQ